MKSILMTAVGAPEVLKCQNIDAPDISDNSQIKVRLHAVGVNPVDTKIRQNGVFYDQPLPAVLGCDGAGVVVETGAAVSRFKVGDKVWFCHGGLGREQGNYAEYTVLDERWAALMPETFSFAEAAASPLVLITAWGGLYDRGGLQAGQTVLVHAGAGGVGHVSIQLAKLKGARVIATTRTEQQVDFVRSMGADEVVIYKPDGLADAVNNLTDGKGADLVFDTVGGAVFKESISATAHYGRLVTLLDPGELSLAEARMRNLLIGFELMLTPMLRDLTKARQKHVEILEQCAGYGDKGLLKPYISKLLALEEAVDAHKFIETGHTTGKIVLSIC